MTIRNHQVEQLIRDVMDEVAAETGREELGVIEGNTVLTESGLDSLGFAILIARLEQKTGYDPFSRLPADQIPHTFSELVAVYQREL
ncbi:MAG: acyl carrier protein [Aliidiomarina sp.]|uniref:acyl carrier protein n=1 Tax=Aliidiomarina sp. TaxID=1872439 RepID=UPI0025C71E2E|nr:acyl carrier protein [Aliidiomarina sp.]MCH8502247.1 acyl carrier protein [Aliidiomarina sp.]